MILGKDNKILEKMKEFKINKFLKLKLEDDKTIIYLEEKRYQQCKSLLLNIHINENKNLNDIETIDEAAIKLDKSLEENENQIYELSPEIEFWAHCSNLQVWAEQNYDTRLLHSNLAFSLLKELYYLGDPIAVKVFKEEIIKRLSINYPPVILYLADEDFLEFFTDEEWIIILSDDRLKIVTNLIVSLPLIFQHDELLADYLVENIKKYIKNENVYEYVIDQIFKLLMYDSENILIEIICYEFYKYLDKYLIQDIFENPNSLFMKNLKKILKYKEGKNGKNLDFIYESIALFFKFVKERNESVNINSVLNKNIKLKSIFDIV